MLRFFAGAADLTPKITGNERDPFDALAVGGATTDAIGVGVVGAGGLGGGISGQSSRTSSLMSGTRTPGPGSVPRTPTSSYDIATGIFGPLPSNLPTPGGALTAAPTTSLSRTEPDFTFKTSPSNLTRNKKAGQHTSTSSTSSTTPRSSPKGQLSVKIIQAKNLNAPGSDSRPYVVASFDQNDFVSREAIPESEMEVRTLVHGGGGSSSQLHGLAGGGSTATLQSLGQTTRPAANDGGGGGGAAPIDKGGQQQPGGLSRSLEKLRNGTGAGFANRADNDAASAVSAHNPTWKHEVIFDVVNQQSRLQVTVFGRTMEEDFFLGMAEVQPKWISGHADDAWYKLGDRGDDTVKVTGEIRLQVTYTKEQSNRRLSAKDFDFLKMIGRGTFGRVFQVRKRDTKRIYAMKVISKREVIAKKEIAHTIGERKILQQSSECPFLLGLKFSFQSENELYLVMDYKSGGELFHHLQKEGRFTEERARFYTAEIVLAFEYLHKYNIVYRDLKPENILLDATGHVTLCDFGLSKPDLPSDALTNTFCGTTEYLAPETLLDEHGYSYLVDFWSLGVLLFEMCCGWSPFYAEDTQQMYKNICFGKIKFPRGVIGDDEKQFVKGLLNRNPKHRLGAQRDAAELKEHPFFKTIDWELLAARQVTPPFKPFVDADNADTSESVANFDPEFTEADLDKEVPSDVDFDEHDPSEAWLDRAAAGPRGSKSTPWQPGPLSIRNSRRSRTGRSSPPLSGSVQDHFRGFSFAGESSVAGVPGDFSKWTTIDSDADAREIRG